MKRSKSIFMVAHHAEINIVNRVENAVSDIAIGRPVVVVDAEDRENEGDLIFAAEKATPELMAFMVRYTSGYVCTALTGADCDRLDLPPMCRINEDPKGTAYTVTVDARYGVTTGISARDRARTVRLLADPTATSADFSRPGHLAPLRAHDGGILSRPGHTEAAVELSRMAGLHPSGVISEIVSSRNMGDMARYSELKEFSVLHDLQLISIADLITYKRRASRG
ncbi:3,4-dihydroxy-2-butanone-4-phosphate synthase [Streptomyces sp. NPDC002952]|uniref:3,4-dihydroxy-2-butanone-4-phosphate synthase n=1 Tax=Streptomyces sp. NPDC002952 TaxID=3364673 RepID=UPI0036CC1838